MNPIKKVFIIVFFIPCMLVISHPCSAGETVRITTGEFPPFVSNNLKHKGFVTRIIKESFRLVDVEARFKFFPWNRSKALVKAGTWDACSFWAKMPEIEKHFYLSDTVATGTLVFFHPKTLDFEWKSVKDLERYRLGGVLGNIYGEAVKNAEKMGRIHIKRLPSEVEALELLVRGGFDVMPINKDAGYYLLNKNFDKKVVNQMIHHPKPIRTSLYTLIFSKKSEKSKRLLKLFNKGLSMLKQSGAHARYVQESRNSDYADKP